MSAPATAPVASARASTGSCRRVARVAVLGPSGYVGQEFVRLAMTHPGLRLEALASREFVGRSASEFLPGLDERADTLPEAVAPADLETAIGRGGIDTVIACLPHGAWKALTIVFPALSRVERVVDLSADHRDGTGGYHYGLPEGFRATLVGASRIANPGCYATAASLALLPAAEAGLLAGPVMVSALSGVSGAGRMPQLRTSFAELDGGASFYRVGVEHPHVPEIERTLAQVDARRSSPGRSTVRIGFAPQLVPMTRGILLTASAPLARPLGPDEACALWASRYASEPFVRVLPAGSWPETRNVCRSNRCDLAATTVHDGSTLLVAAALDNLGKGAAGQAVQNLNLQLGWPEETGLERHGSPQ